MTPSKAVFFFCLSFIGGILLSSFFKISQPAFLGILVFGSILISTLWKYKKAVLLGFCVLFFSLGIWRHQTIENKARQSKIAKFNDQKEIVTLIGRVSSEPDFGEKIQKLTLKIENLGKILVITNRYPEYRYGDKIKVTGFLKTPKETDDFNYKDYLKKDGIYSLLEWPKIELIERGNYQNLNSFIYAKILDFKNKLRESIYQNLSPPQSSILGAIILGDKRKISQEWKEKLNITGLRHITAISGLHITVLTTILMNFLIWLGFWRKQAFYLTIILIFLFILMIGFQPSAIRAAIMGGLFLLAQQLGRLNNSSRAIFFAATLMLFQNPLLLKLDLGFQLSFLATLGIVYLTPIFRDWLNFIPWENPKSILAMTFSAYLFTLPILIYNFGYIPLFSLFTNILVVPLLSWIMIFGFIFALAGILWSSLSLIFSFPVWLLLSYLIKVVDFFCKIPWASKTIENVHWVFLVIFYLILAIFIWRLKEKQKLKFLNY
jgi:competence protein ComEC